MEVYNLKDKLEHLNEVAYLEHEEWADSKDENKSERIKRKKDRICSMFSNNAFCKLILINKNKLIGFISIFPHDGEEELDIGPWYATMYVKKEYRNKGYSRILNDAILNEAKKRGFRELYLKTDLENYYEKFGAHYLKDLKCGEKLYRIDVI